MATVERTVRSASRVASLALVAGTALLSGALWLFGGGPVGVLVGVAVGFIAAASESHYGVGLGHVSALLVTATPTLEGVAVLELASVAYLAAESTDGRRAVDAALLLVASATAIALVTTLTAAFGTLAAAAVLVGVAGTAGYALSRIGLWNLGVIPEGAS